MSKENTTDVNCVLHVDVDGSINLRIKDKVFEYSKNFDPDKIVETLSENNSVLILMKCPRAALINEIFLDRDFYYRWNNLIDLLSRSKIEIRSLVKERSATPDTICDEKFIPVFMVSIPSPQINKPFEDHPDGTRVINVSTPSSQARDNKNSSSLAYVDELSSQSFQRKLSYVLAKDMVDFRLEERAIFVGYAVMNDINECYKYSLKALCFGEDDGSKTDAKQ